MLDLVEQFFALKAHPPASSLRDESLSGTLESLTSGQSDLAHWCGAPSQPAHRHAKQTPGALHCHGVCGGSAPPPGQRCPSRLTNDADWCQHRIVAVADTVHSAGAVSAVGLLGGQEVFTVANMQRQARRSVARPGLWLGARSRWRGPTSKVGASGRQSHWASASGTGQRVSYAWRNEPGGSAAPGPWAKPWPGGCMR